MKILLVEDDLMIGENIQIALEDDGIDADWVKRGMDAESFLASNSYDALLLDLGLPQKDGIDILKDLRAGGNRLPVMIISARELVQQRILGFNSGADDYVIKPFDMNELIARLRALVRRAEGRLEPVYEKGNVRINRSTREVHVGDKQVLLSAREWSTLEALVTRPGAVLSRAQLEERVYGGQSEYDSNSIEVFIHGLRKKLGAQFITNVRGMGYVIEKD